MMGSAETILAISVIRFSLDCCRRRKHPTRLSTAHVAKLPIPGRFGVAGSASPFDGLQRFDLDLRDEFRISSMKMWRWVFIEIELNPNTVNDRDRWHSTYISHIQHQPSGVFQAFLHAHEERHRF